MTLSGAAFIISEGQEQDVCYIKSMNNVLYRGQVLKKIIHQNSKGKPGAEVVKETHRQLSNQLLKTNVKELS